MNLDTQEIVRLYIDEELPVREIATRLGSSYGRVYGILQSRVIMRRGRRRNLEYVKIARIMRERIVTGNWPPGCKILGQHELAQIFDVKHQTIREATNHLRQRGYLTTVPSKGTYVRPPQDWESGSHC